MNFHKHIDRFWSKVEKTKTCWLWTAGKDFDGYGQFSDKGKNYRSQDLLTKLKVKFLKV
jgi:hypothetical protein